MLHFILTCYNSKKILKIIYLFRLKPSLILFVTFFWSFGSSRYSIIRHCAMRFTLYFPDVFQICSCMGFGSETYSFFSFFIPITSFLGFLFFVLLSTMLFGIRKCIQNISTSGLVFLGV